jgi:RNA polymerase sigma-70 factor (ECF subfamily)
VIRDRPLERPGAATATLSDPARRPRWRPARRRHQLRDLADEELMELVHAGEVAAFDVIFDRHGSVAYSLALRVCRRQAMAEEAVQEAFLSLWRSRARYDPLRGSVRAWVLRVVHNRAIDALRRASAGAAGAEVPAEHDLAERVPAPELTEALVLDRDDARRLRQALDSLPEEQRRAIELAFFDGLTHVEIARLLELPPGTVKGRIRLGLQKLRDALEHGGESIEPAGGLEPAER